MGEIVARNTLSRLKLLIKLSLLHLVDCLYYYINDARSHKHQTQNETGNCAVDYLPFHMSVKSPWQIFRQIFYV